jgi:hypothetical protein
MIIGSIAGTPFTVGLGDTRGGERVERSQQVEAAYPVEADEADELRCGVVGRFLQEVGHRNDSPASRSSQMWMCGTPVMQETRAKRLNGSNIFRKNSAIAALQP